MFPDADMSKKVLLSDVPRFEDVGLRAQAVIQGSPRQPRSTTRNNLFDIHRESPLARVRGKSVRRCVLIWRMGLIFSFPIASLVYLISP